MMLLFKQLISANYPKLHYNCNMIDYKLLHSENVTQSCVVDANIHYVFTYPVVLKTELRCKNKSIILPQPSLRH